jgi:ABC-type antimicrobial peptide transport system permease subunit
MRLSLFQGAILISEEQFTRLYPSENGYRGFLIQTSPDTMEMEMADLQKKYERFGMDVVPAVRRLSEFYRVESTYLAMFLVLGGLGVTLGAIGMGVIMLRNLLERRGEMAMLLCLGYAPATLLALLFMEHIFLLLAGVGLGGVASGVAMIPALFISDAKISYGVQGAVVCIVLASGMASMTTAILMTRTGRILEALRNE